MVGLTKSIQSLQPTRLIRSAGFGVKTTAMETTYTNDQIDAIIDKYPLLGEGYASLECPRCDILCFPVHKYANGTIRYNAHSCILRVCGVEYGYAQTKSFSILEDGSIKE